MNKNYIILLLAFFGLSNYLLNAQTPNLLWAKQMGGATTDRVYSIAVDATGNVYTTGAFTGTADFNPSTDPNTGTYNLTAVGNYDIFISKLDASGNFIWAKQFGGISADYGYSIAVDANGYVYTTGYFQGTVDFNPGNEVNNLTSAGSEDIFVSKLDASGNFVWAKSIGGSNSQIGYSIAVNSIGNVYTTGYFQSTVDFDPSAAGAYNLTSVGYYDIFVSALDASGNFLWAKRMGGGSSAAGCGAVCRGSIGKSIALDSNGNVYTTGYFPGTGDFDPGIGVYNLTAGGSTFVSKLDPSGNFVWAKQIGGGSTEGANSIAIDANSNVYTTGVFGSTDDFDPSNGVYNLTPIGSGTNTFISKLDASGNFVWAKSIGGGPGGTCGGPCYGSSGNAIAIDANGNVYTTGFFRGAPDFDPGPGTYNLTTYSSSNFDIFVSKLNASGDFVWAIQMGGPSGNNVNLPYDNGNAIALDANENIYTSGSFYFTADFDPGNGIFNLVSGNNSNNTFEDIFVVKLCQITTPIITGPTSFCQGSSVTLTSSSSNSYLWSNMATTQSITVSSSGNYSVTVTNASGCTASSTITTVIVNPLPTGSITPASATVTCTTPSATLTASGGVTCNWSNNLGTNCSVTVTPASTTTYAVTVTAANGCTDTESVTVTVDKAPPTANITPASATVTCANPSATLTASGGGAYFWSNGLGTNPTVTVSPSSTTTYTVIVTATNGCTDTESITVTVDKAPPTANIAPTSATVTCAVASATLTASGGGTYSWSNGLGTNPTVTVSPSSTTTYTVTVTATNGCTDTESATVTAANALPTAIIAPASATVTCANPSATLSASGGGTYLWSNGLGTNPIVTVNPSSTTTYTVTVTAVNGCTDTESVTVTAANALPTAIIAPASATVTCANPSANLTASGGGAYLWSNGLGTNPTVTVTPVSTTTYTVTVTAVNGSCTDTESVTVTVDNAPPTASISPINPTVTCASPSATLAAAGGGTYLWSNGFTTNSITVNPLSTTAYTVTVTETNNGCTDTESVTVTVDKAPPTASISPASATINCTTLSATLTALGGVAYSWSNGLGTTPTVAVAPASTMTSTVTVTAANGCTDTESVTVTVDNAPPTASIAPVSATVTCTAPSATLTASGGGTYSWSNGPTGMNPIIVTPTSTTTYTVTVTAANNCTDTESVIVTAVNVPPIATISSSNPVVTCTNPSATLTASGGGIYLWSNGSGTNSIIVTPASTTTYTVTVTAANGGCTDTESVTVTVDKASPTASITPASATVTCDVGSATLIASGGVTYLWDNGLGTNDTVIVSPSVTTIYTVIVTAANGCTGMESVTVTADNTPPTASISGLNSFCAGGSTVLTASGGTSFAWNTSETTASVTVTSEGTYTVTVTNANGCTDEASQTVTMNPAPPTPSIIVYITTCVLACDILLPNGTYMWHWNGGMVGGNFQFLDADTVGNGFYTVQITDGNGCTAISQLTPVNCVIDAVNELTSISDLTIYPNPTTGRFTVSLKSDEVRDVEILCTNLLGQSIFSKEYNLSNGELKTELDLSAVGKGLYLVQVRRHGKSVFRKMSIVE